MRIFLHSPSLLTSVLVLSLLTLVPANAQTNALESGAAAGFDAPVALRAESIRWLREEGRVLAEGNVELRQGAWILLARRLSYEEATGMVRAWGDVALSTPEGEVVFADEASFVRDLREGDASEVSMRLVDDSRLAARSAQLRGERSFLERAVYSACRPCEEGENESEGEGAQAQESAASEPSPPPPPIWRIKAFRVERDEGAGVIRYEDAYLEFFGVPIFYTPFFAHADPAIDKRSGFLLPRFSTSSLLGVGVEFPYFWNLAPHYDFTFAPRFYSDGDILWQGGWRHGTPTGSYVFDAAAVLESHADATPQVEDGFRGALFGDGRFQPADKWAWGFNLQASTDDTFPRRFDLSQETEFTSSLFAEHFDERELLRIHGYYFQGLLEDDSQSRTPIILPLLEYSRELRDAHFGGRVLWEGNFLILAREKGAQSRRLSSSLTWDREVFDPFGSVYGFKVNLRGDLYHVENVPYADGSNRGRSAELISRLLPTIGAEWRFPLLRSADGRRILIEPIAQLLLSPQGGNPSGIPNEDSVSFEFDDTNLFAVDKFSGLDLWEGGERVRYGARAVFIGEEVEAGMLFGQEYRLQNQDSFAQLTGLHDDVSDYIGSGSLQWRGFRTEQRFRLDRKRHKLRLHDVGVSGTLPSDIDVSVRYAYLSEDISTTERSESEVRLRGDYRFHRNWNAYAYLRRDLSKHKLLYNGMGISYADECFQAQLELRNDFRRDRDVEPESAIFFRVALTGLGAWDGLSDIDDLTR